MTVIGDERVVDVAAVSPFDVAATSRPNQEDIVTDVPAASVHECKHNHHQQEYRYRQRGGAEVGVRDAMCGRESST